MAGGEAWRQDPPILAQAAHWHGRQYRRDRCFGFDHECTNDVDDASQAGPLLDQLDAQLASFTGDGAYDQDSLYRAVTNRDPEALVIVPPRATAVPSETAETKPTQRDQHLQDIAAKAGSHGKRRRSILNEAVWRP